MMAVLVQGKHLHWNVPSRRILLQVVEHRPAQHVGQEDVQRNRGGMELAGQGESFRAAQGYKNFESLVARQITEHAGVVRIVFDDQQNSIVGLQIVAIVQNLLDRMFRHDDIGQLEWHRGRYRSPFRRCQLRRGRSDVGERQIQCERAALAGRAAKLNFAAQQACEFTADGQT